jgi:hypothetical protein
MVAFEAAIFFIQESYDVKRKAHDFKGKTPRYYGLREWLNKKLTLDYLT